jgi:branched-chain amino acid transport system ATP-binding protein
VTPLLETHGLSVSFGAVRAVDGVDLVVEPGELVGVIGPNGAGKTTLVDALTGFVPAAGSITFAGRDLTGKPPHVRARAGLARTWQSLELFDDLTVGENLQVAAEPAGARHVLADLVRPHRPKDLAPVDEALHAVGIAELAGAMPEELSQGQRKLVGVARALAARPQLVCLDEPAAGLDTAESETLGRRLRRLVGSGLALLLIDHDMGLVLEVCDRVVVLEFGRVIAEGAPTAIRSDERVIAAYLGEKARR